VLTAGVVNTVAQPGGAEGGSALAEVGATAATLAQTASMKRNRFMSSPI
jgi:hypothetical protein